MSSVKGREDFREVRAKWREEHREEYNAQMRAYLAERRAKKAGFATYAEYRAALDAKRGEVKQKRKNGRRVNPAAHPTKVCPVCGVTFTALFPRQICCTRACGIKYQNVKLIKTPSVAVCPVCGGHFKPKPKQKYCSERCYQTAQNRIEAARRAAVRNALRRPADGTEDRPRGLGDLVREYHHDERVAAAFAYGSDEYRRENFGKLTKRQRKLAEQLWKDRWNGANGTQQKWGTM